MNKNRKIVLAFAVILLMMMMAVVYATSLPINGTVKTATHYFYGYGEPMNKDSAQTNDLYLNLDNNNLYQLQYNKNHGTCGDSNDYSWILIDTLQGLQGAKGDTGAQGVQGLQGIQGIAGQDGKNGTNGSIWFADFGVPTFSANVNDMYLDLRTGDVYQYDGNFWHLGCNIKGVQGEQGIAGKDGINGTDGKDGLNGTNGIDGIDGLNGTNGIDGKDGAQGIQGLTGATGEQGIQGDKGDTGAQGEQGIQGTQGERGEQGIQGEQGVAGKDGTNGVDGTNGLNGKDGVNGQRCSLNYHEGIDPTMSNITSPLKDDAYFLINGDVYVYNGTAWVYFTNLKGATGLMGAMGLTGANGKNGINGTNGTNGKDGITVDTYTYKPLPNDLLEDITFAVLGIAGVTVGITSLYKLRKKQDKLKQ